MIGDGTAGQFAPILYEMHTGADTVVVNADANAGKLYIRAKTSLDSLPVRVDVQDNGGYLSSLAGLEMMVRNDWQVFELDYTGKYLDGGFGGTSCAAGPCAVDPKRIQFLQIYILPGVGMFQGELDIDWISFGQPLQTSSVDLDLLNGVSIFPNPVKEIFTIELDSKTAGNGQLIVSNVTGKQILTDNNFRINSGYNKRQYNLSGANPGLYLVQVLLDGQIAFTKKLVVRN